MRRFLLFGFLLFPFLGAGQVVDTVGVKKTLDSLYQVYGVLRAKGDFDKALEVIAVAEKVVIEKLGRESAAYGQACFNHGTLLHQKEDYLEAEKWYLEGKTIIEKTLDRQHTLLLYSLHNLGCLYRDIGIYEKAEPLFLEAIDIYEKTHNTEAPLLGFCLNNLASLYAMMAAYEKAEPLYFKSKAICEKLLGKENPEYAANLNNLAILYEYMGNYEKSEPLYLEAVDIREKVQGKENPDYVWTLNNLGSFYSRIGNHKKAELLCFEAKAICEKVSGKESIGYFQALSNLATNYCRTNNFEKAEPLFLEALAIQEKLLGKEHPDYATGLINLAALYMDMGNYLKAEPIFLEALVIRKNTLGKAHPDYAQNLYGLAYVNWFAAKFETTLPYLLEAAEIDKNLLFKASRHLSERELSSYIEQFYDGLNLYCSFGQTQNGLSSACYDNTLFYKGFLLNAVSEVGKLAVTNSATMEKYYQFKSYHRRLAAIYVAPITERDSSILSELEEKANALEKELTRSVAGLGEALRRITWQEAQSQLRPGEAAIEFVNYNFVNPRPTDSIMYAALLLMPGDTSPHFIPLCEQRQLDALIPERKGPMHIYLQNLYSSTRADGLASLYQLFWEPLERIFKEKSIQTVYYSPSGLLHRLNLAAIAPDKSGQTLADRYRLIPVGSTRSLAVDAKAGQLVTGSKSSDAAPLRDALIYGGVRYDMDSAAIASANTMLHATAEDTTGGLFRYVERSGTDRGDTSEYLPGTEKEARYLHNLLEKQGVSSTLRLGYSATEESVKQIGRAGPSPSLLHFGTHGFFFPDPKDTTRRRATFVDDAPAFKISEHPLIRSGLKLAGADYAWNTKRPMHGMEDGILTAYEVSQLNLSNTELVVLSACETGLGEIKGNEGVYGLQRAFRIAGAKNVLMSLWKVPDEATEKLMTRFYQNWLEQKMPLREAFEKAQSWMRSQELYQNPYFWAGFVLIGDL